MRHGAKDFRLIVVAVMEVSGVVLIYQHASEWRQASEVVRYWLL